MTLVFGEDNAFFSLRIEDVQYTDGYALVTGGLQLLGDDLNAAATTVRDAYVDIFRTATWTTSTIGECTVITETDIGVAGGSTAGTGPSTGFASVNTTPLCEKVSSHRGRRGRGRWFMPSMLTEGAIFGDGTLDTGFVNNINARLETWFTFDDPGLRPHAIPQGEQQPRKNGEPGTPPILPWPSVTDLYLDPKAATQRRRMRR